MYNIENKYKGKWIGGKKGTHYNMPSESEAVKDFNKDASRFYPGVPKRLRNLKTNKVLAAYQP